MTDLKKNIRYFPVFVLFACVYFNDIFLRDALLAVEDGFQYYYPLMLTMAEQYKDCNFPFWNPLEYSGFPLFASHEPGALYPFNIILPLVLTPVWAFNLNLILHYAFAGFFTFLYARQIGLPVFASLISGTVFSLLGYLPAHLNHQNIISAAAWIPLLLFFYERLKCSLEVRYALYAALVIAVQFFGGHPQICFYTYLLLLAAATFSLFQLDRDRRKRFILLVLLSLVLGLLLALPQIAATLKLAARGMRTQTTYNFFASYSFPLHMVPTFLFPFFYYLGGQSGQMWGTVPLIGQDAFSGTFPILICLVVILKFRKNHYILFWSVISIFAFILSLGDSLGPLNRLLFSLPLYNSFRAHSKLILLVSFGLSILTGFGVSFLMESQREKRFVAVLGVVLFTVVTASVLLFTFFSGPLEEFIENAFMRMQHYQLHWDLASVPENALHISNPSLYVPIIVMSLYLVCILGILMSRNKRTSVLILAGVFLVLFVEAKLWKTYDIPHRDEVEGYHEELFSMLSLYPEGRTAFLTGNISPLSAMPYGIDIAGGYESLETENYAKIFPRMYLQPAKTWRAYLENNAALSMLNVKYLVVSRMLRGVDKIRKIIIRDGEGRFFPLSPRGEGTASADAIPIYRRISDFEKVSLYENRLALPRAYAVLELEPLDSADDVRRSLFSSLLHPWYEASVSSEDIEEIGSRSFNPGTVELDEREPDRLMLSTDFQGEGFVVLADRFYPGWEAYIDGMRTKIYRTNGIQRGVIVPEGKHTIIFQYTPRLIYAAMAVSFATFLTISFSLLRGVLRRKKPDKKFA